jgi:SAM-dependent methyltransferase
MGTEGHEPSIPDGVRHAAMRWNAPLSEAHAAVLLDALELGCAEGVLDLGCGWGELLCRAVERASRLTGIGIDTDKSALARGRALAAGRGLGERITLIDTGGEAWTEPADRVICVGASHIWNGTAAALQALAPLVACGGRLLYGDGYLEPGSSEFTAGLFGQFGTLAQVLGAAQCAGWRILHLSVSDQLEWDEFESTFRAGPERWLLAEPEVEGADEVRAWLNRRLREYVDGYRGELGFCWLVLAH